MRYIGWTLGGLYLVDGLVALGGGKPAIKWANKTIGKSMPSGLQRMMKEAEKVDDRILTAWGINNVIAGLGILLVASLASRED